MAVTKVVCDSGGQRTGVEGMCFQQRWRKWLRPFLYAHITAQMPDFNSASIEESGHVYPDNSASCIMWPHQVFFVVNI